MAFSPRKTNFHFFWQIIVGVPQTFSPWLKVHFLFCLLLYFITTIIIIYIFSYVLFQLDLC